MELFRLIGQDALNLFYFKNIIKCNFIIHIQGVSENYRTTPIKFLFTNRIRQIFYMICIPF